MSQNLDALKMEIAQAKSVMQTAAATIRSLREGSSISSPDALDALGAALSQSRVKLEEAVSVVADVAPVDEPAPIADPKAEP